MILPSVAYIMAIVGAIVAAILALAGDISALEIKHTPPVIFDTAKMVTLSVRAPDATTVRLLTTKSGFGLTTFELRAAGGKSFGKFEIELPIDTIIGHKYQFQARDKLGEIAISRFYQVSGEADQAKRNRIDAREAEIISLEREIAAKRRTLAALRERTRTVAYDTDPLRARARTLLNPEVRDE